MSSPSSDGSFVVVNGDNTTNSIYLDSCSILNINEEDVNTPVAMDTSASASNGLSHLDTLQIGSLPAVVASTAQEETDDGARKSVSLGAGIDLGATTAVVESINAAVPESDDEESSASSKDPAICESFDVTAFEGYLRILREENEKLKQVLEQNNDAMKRQLKVVQSWQEEVNSTRAAYNGLKADSELAVSKLKDQNEELKEQLEASKGVVSVPDVEVKTTNLYPQLDFDSVPELAALAQNAVESVNKLARQQSSKTDKASDSFFWDNEMSYELSEMRTALERVYQLEHVLREKDGDIEQLQEKLASSKEEVKKMNIEIAELRIARVKEQTVVEVLKNQLELYTADFKAEEESRKAAEEEVRQLEIQLEEMQKERAELREKLELGPAVVNIGEPVVPVESRRQKHHHKRAIHHIRKLSRGHVAGVAEGLNLESFKQYRAT